MTSSTLGSRVQLSGAWTRMVLESFECLDIDTALLCKRAGADRALLMDIEVRVPRDTAGKLWRAAATMTQDRFVGLHAGERNQREPGHFFELLFAKGATFADGVLAGLRFQGLIAHGEVVTLLESGSGKRLKLNKIQSDLPVTHHEIEFIAVTLTNYFRMATANQFRLEKVTFTHPYRGAISEYERIFACPVSFGEPETELWIPQSVWDMKLSDGDSNTQRQLVALASELHQRIELAGFTSEVSRAIVKLLPEGLGDVAHAAEELHCSARTLQRRLRAEGTTFREVLDATRRAIVIEGVEQQRGHAEIARRAGLANVRGLARALRRWRSSKGWKPTRSALGRPTTRDP